jgi:hypothetical protein
MARGGSSFWIVFDNTPYPVGAGLPAIAIYQAINEVQVTASSLASQLPQDLGASGIQTKTIS